VADPSGLFISRRETAVPGSCITVVMEGRRPLITEVQALVAATTSPMPRRATQGLESSRIAMILAVLERRAGMRLADRDVYVSTVGGVKIQEPAADLAVVLAVASASSQIPIDSQTAALGEVGLAGEIRNIVGLDRRLAEAARLGFRRAIVPAGALSKRHDIAVIEVADVRDALVAIRADA
jgi:DNA repair protein RadA/Sms